ncbi:MAG: hypothetical protein H6708_22320 [Kofleriaceae bacterium]|nr:hypothetical protein [Myxococcales bacterium]MCB9563142.1 hypothetical protein [Kofleriaceae bacterium]
MDEYMPIYFLDEDDLRNAPRDHRSQDSRPGRWYQPRPAVPVRRPQVAGAVRPRPVAVVAQPVAPVSEERRFLAGLPTGQLLELAAQILAAIQPLPGAPVAQGNVETDVENLIAYQNALAMHAKRDEQLRTIGTLVAALVK